MTDSIIFDYLKAHQDPDYQKFQARLIPEIQTHDVLGVRTPVLRAYARKLWKASDAETVAVREQFLQTLPHTYFEENQLHAFLISLEKDFTICLNAVDAFLPYVNNWATCDQLLPGVFRKNLPELDVWIQERLSSEKTYTVRFAIGMRMKYFLDTEFRISQAEEIAAMRTTEYYINMMRAWYFATALARQYDAAVTFLTQNKMDVWTHNKTLQKAVESYRITPEQKSYLRSLRRRK